MKKLTILFLVLTLVSACKNTKENEVATDETAADTIPKKEYKISLAQWSLNKPIFAGERSPMDFAFVAKELGFDGLEYVSQLYTNEHIDFPLKNAGRDAILEVLKKNSDSVGIQNVLIMIDGEGNLASSDDQEAKKAIENHYKWVDAAAYLGCHSIRVNLSGEESPDAWVNNSVRSLQALGSYAATKGINVIVENHGGNSSKGFLMARVMEQTAMDNVGTLPDFGNFCVVGSSSNQWKEPCEETYDRYKGMEEIMPYAKGVSAKSYAFDENGDEKIIDFYKMMDIVTDSGYEGFIDVEFEGPDEDPIPGIIATKKLIEKALQATNQ